MSELPDLFTGFESQLVSTVGADIFLRHGGNGAAVLLLHGYPQTHACWHRVAAELAQSHTVVAMDLRGYGRSSMPAGDADHLLYSKRAMAADCIEVMKALGHDQFSVVSHDRGARVGYRLALDHPNAVEKLVVLDIVPTSDAWLAMDHAGAMSKFHWTFLSQPAPMPEALIAADPDAWHEHLLKSWNASGGLSVFDETALEHYRRSYRRRECIHAMSEDYRAGVTIDFQLDLADQKAGRKISCPTLALWGQQRSLGTVSNTLPVWEKWCERVEGKPIQSGHFLAEENPKDTLSAILPFLQG
ncbi:alpha/beta hydrolase [Chromatiales bacterium (ex Bugula neritina AB1)]|nr:alpha/beta hydrolase [Chromatiales bacterium (ex Bugula neritina AB1)]